MGKAAMGMLLFFFRGEKGYKQQRQIDAHCWVHTLQTRGVPAFCRLSQEFLKIPIFSPFSQLCRTHNCFLVFAICHVHFKVDVASKTTASNSLRAMTSESTSLTKLCRASPGVLPAVSVEPPRPRLPAGLAPEAPSPSRSESALASYSISSSS